MIKKKEMKCDLLIYNPRVYDTGNVKCVEDFSRYEPYIFFFFGFQVNFILTSMYCYKYVMYNIHV